MKVSVIIPVYNADATIRETLESVLAQTYADFEVICVVDSGSADTSRQIVEEYASLHPGKVVPIYPPHQNAAEARNTGLASSTGDSILFLDSDDRIEETYLSKVVPLMTEYVVVVATDMQYFGEKSSTHSSSLSTTADNNLPVTALVRKSAASSVNGYDPTMLWDDWDFWLRVQKECGRVNFVFLHEPLFHYRIGINHLSASVNLRRKEADDQIRLRHTHVKAHKPSGFDIDTCKWVVWGAKRPYNTFGHIHEAFLRALKFLGKDAAWLDVGDDTTGIDFSNTCFISMNCVIEGMPRRKDCFYVIHNGNHPECMPAFKGLKMLVYGVHTSTSRYGSMLDLGPDIYFDLPHRLMVLRWGTDLLPHEIEANKPATAFNAESRVVNYIGTIDESNRELISNFRRACAEYEIDFEHYGGCGDQDNPPVSIEENASLIRASYIAPTIQRLDQVDMGYVPCRLFKNISYGQFGVTHSPFANDLFGGRLIYNPDTYRLFYDAKERLESMQVEELHSLMDEVAAKHTYLNKTRAIIRAVEMLEED